MSDSASIQEMLDDCEDFLDDMTDWEVEFIERVRGQLDQGRTLSSAQEEKLEQIWEKVT